ncbi:MAG: hypothetical protein J6031_07955 [Bacteroidales bacterium]|nr:hypothetical protein [Bacteroidales bacterium]
MAKQEKFIFDYEGYFDEKLENTAILMWSTHHPAFTFAFYLNQLYNLNLERQDDITSEGGNNKLYSYQSDADHHAFFLIEQPTQGSSAIFDKILLVMGADAFETAQYIYDETSKSVGQSHTTSPSERDTILQSFIENGIFESALFNFSDPDKPETTYFPNNTANAALQKKRARFLKEQREKVSDLIMALDPLLPNFD